MKVKMSYLTQMFGLLVCLLMLIVAGNAQAYIIDHFSSGATGPVNPVSPTSTYDTTASAAIGGARGMAFVGQWDASTGLPLTGANSSIKANISPSLHVMSFSNDYNTQSAYLVTWAGPGGTGFTPVNITDGGASDYLTFRLASIDHGSVDIIFTITDSASNTSAASGAFSVLQTYQIPFASFVGGADFTDVTSIEMNLSTRYHDGDTDLSIDIIETGGREVIPEPSTLLLIGAGLVSVAGYATMRNRTKKD